MESATARERKALQNAWLGGEWEHRSKLGGEKTFNSLIEKGWLIPFGGHNPSGDRFSITVAGRETLHLTSELPRMKTVLRTPRKLEPRAKSLESEARHLGGSRHKS